MPACPVDNTIPFDGGSLIINAWLIGFIFPIFTKSQWAGISLYSIILYMMFWPSVFRELDEPARFDFHIYPLLTFIFGSINGYVFSLVFEVPRLLDLRIIHSPRERGVSKAFDEDDPRRVKVEGVLLILGAFFVIMGYLFLTYSFGNGCDPLMNDISLGLGIGCIIVGSLIIITILIWGLWWRKTTKPGERRNNRADFFIKQNIKYAILLALIILTYLFYDIFGTGTLRGAWALIYLTGIMILAYPYIIYLSFNYHGYWVGGLRQIDGVVVRMDKLGPKKYVTWLLVFIWLNAAITHATGYVIIIFATTVNWVVSLTLVGVSIFFILLWTILYAFDFYPMPILRHDKMVSPSMGNTGDWKLNRPIWRKVTKRYPTHVQTYISSKTNPGQKINSHHM